VRGWKYDGKSRIVKLQMGGLAPSKMIDRITDSQLVKRYLPKRPSQNDGNTKTEVSYSENPREWTKSNFLEEKVNGLEGRKRL